MVILYVKEKTKITYYRENEYKGKEVYQQDIIKKVFAEFYSKLYASDTIQGLDIDRYLQEANIPIVTQEQRDGMNYPITSEEIILAIKQLKMGKAPGTDGLTATYYKSLRVEMLEPLKELFRIIQMGGEVPPSWRTAFISLIPKEDQDLSQPKNYRPISFKY